MKRILAANRVLLFDILGGLALLFILLIFTIFGLSLSDTSFRPVTPSIGYMLVPESKDSFIMIDSGKSRVMGVRDGKLEFELLVGSTETTFYQAENLCIDPSDGSFYVHSVDWDSSGYLLASERILHFDSNGKYLSTPYTKRYTPEDEVNQHRLFDPQIINGKLYVVYADEDSICQLRIENGKEIRTAEYRYKDAWIYFQNYKQTVKGELYGVDKRGAIIYFTPELTRTVYNYDRDSHEVIYFVEADVFGNVYYTDIYNGRICRIVSPTESTTLVDVKDLYGDREFYPGQDQMTTIKLGADGKRTLLGFMLNERALITDTLSTQLQECDSIHLGSKIMLKAVLVILMLVPACLLLLYFLLRCAMVLVIVRPRFKFIWKLEIGFAVFALLLTFFILSISGTMFGRNYMQALGDKITDIAIAGSNSIDSDLIDGIDEMSDFMDDDYRRLSDILYRMTTENHGYLSRYGAEIEILDDDGRAYCIAYVDNSIGVYYPLDSGTKEDLKHIYSSRSSLSNLDQLSAGGTFIYGRAPILDKDGNVLAVLAIAQDSYREQEKLASVTRHIMISIILFVIIIMFMINEGFVLTQGLTDYRAGRCSTIYGKRVPMHAMRIAAFGISFVLNMTSSFLSVYTSSFWSESLGISPSMAGAIPLFANGVFTALSALFCPFLLSKLGFMGVTAIGVACSGCGDLLAGLSQGYTSIVMALLLNGLGFGILINTISITIGRVDGENDRKNGYAQFNAGCISGINCGMIFGSVLVSVIRYNQVFFVTTALWITLIFIFIYLRAFIPPVDESRKRVRIHGQLNISMQSILYAAMIAFPYAVAGSFMYFYLPLFVTSMGYSEEYVSILMMIYAACGIFLGKVLTDIMWEKFRKWSVLFAIVLAMVAWMIIASSTSIDVVAMAMVLIGISFSFGLNVTMSAYLSQKGVVGMNQDDAVGIYEFSSRAGQCLSSIICGLMMGAGIVFGMGVFSILSIVMFLLYEIIYRNGTLSQVEEKA